LNKTSTVAGPPLTFELFAFRFQFRALESMYFPAGKAGNIIRGTLGRIFRKFVCTPACREARSCAQRSVCAYARLFEPTALVAGPSGLADQPRPFVIRAAHLDGRRFLFGESFHFDLMVFEMRDPALAYFAFSFSQVLREGMGPGRPGAELVAIHSLLASGQAGAQIFDGQTLAEPGPMILPLNTLSLDLPSPNHLAPTANNNNDGHAVERVRIQFVTPTELKAEGKVVREPQFGVLFARVRDRIHTLRSLYGEGPLDLDFSASGERARAVKLVHSDLRWEAPERRSGRTGQTHSLGGFTGRAEYQGNLTEFLPYLQAASWTGVGRQTTWGKGQIEVTVLVP
jgi:hypothetical protein